MITVRQIFYQLVARGIVPKSESRGYRPVQTQVLKMRREDILDWGFVADATRWVRKPKSWDSVDDALSTQARTYRRNLWWSQGIRIEVWLEKDALAAVIMDATAPWDVPLMVSRGTSSETFLREAAVEAADAWEEARVTTHTVALYDHDAAGARAARNVENGLSRHAFDVPIQFEQIAVTEDQIEEWELPTRPPKKTDPEAAKWEGLAVELDAIPPDKLIGLVDYSIEDLVDPEAWAKEQQVEQSERELLQRMVRGAA